MNTYILQKDLPDSKAGDEYSLIGGDSTRYYKNGDGGESYWMFHDVEDNPEWFKLKEENEITKAKELLESKGYIIVEGSKNLTKAIKNYYDAIAESFKLKKEAQRQIFEKQLTQARIDAFNSARVSMIIPPIQHPYVYRSAEDYISHLNKVK